MSTNPNVVILNKAWALLWSSSSQYYLPHILQNGGTFGSVTIPAMVSVTLPDIDPIPLYSSDTWGSVSITLSSMTLGGLPSIQNQSFTPAADASSVQAVVAFGMLTFAGSYEGDGTGVTGCAMDLGESHASQARPWVDGEQDSAVEDPPPVVSHMPLAEQQRDQLVQTPNGLQLVSAYYDHNDAMNYILNNANAFTAAWPVAETPAGSKLTTKVYMNITAAAAKNPDNPAYTVGGPDYNGHGLYMEVLLKGTALHYAGGDETSPFYALATESKQFEIHTQCSGAANPLTVNDAYTAVNNASVLSAEELESARATVYTEEAQAAIARGERDYPMWEARAAAMEQIRAEQAKTYESSGQFSFSFPMPTLTFSGTVTISGIAPDQTLTVQLTSLTAAVPSVIINLLTGSDPSFTSDMQQKINDAAWFQSILGTKVNAQLGSSAVLTYVSNLFNEALKGAIGSASRSRRRR